MRNKKKNSRRRGFLQQLRVSHVISLQGCKLVTSHQSTSRLVVQSISRLKALMTSRLVAKPLFYWSKHLGEDKWGTQHAD